MHRQIVLDTETTGLDVTKGDRIIEIGCIEIIDRKVGDKTFHQYINPERLVDLEAFKVHGISDAFLADKPKFAEISQEFLEFIQGAELIIHNAAFDIGFINAELQRLNLTIENLDCTITDTLEIARKKHPAQKNSLDAICKRYGIDNSNRTFHGALLDAVLLAKAYLAMTGGQGSLFALNDEQLDVHGAVSETWQDFSHISLIEIIPTALELEHHTHYLNMLAETADRAIWLAQES